MIKDATSETLTTVRSTGKDFFESKTRPIVSPIFTDRIVISYCSSVVVELEMQDVVYQYLYEAGGLVYLLNPRTLEEISVPSQLVQGNLSKLLEGGAVVKVRMNGDQPVLVHPSVRNVKCTVSRVIDKTISKPDRPWIRDCHHSPACVDSDRKIVIVETLGGAKLTCSTLISEGDQILVNVDELTYQGRAL